MADLRAATDESGQIMLIAALTLGVTFVALALILNSAIFTENLASRGETTDADGVIVYHGDLQRGVGAVVYEENRNASGASHADVLTRIKTGVGDVNTITLRRKARQGVIANVAVASTANGSRIFQTNASRNFTDDSGTENWTVANDVDRARAVSLTVDSSTLPSTCTLLGDCFIVSFSDGSSDWNVSIVRSGIDEIAVEVDNETGLTQTCGPVTGESVEMDLTAGTVGGVVCRPLDFGDAPSGTFDIEFYNANEVHGTYSMIVDDPTIAQSPPVNLSGSGDPSVTPALYNLTLRYHYQTAVLNATNNVTITPEEYDGR